MSLRLETKGHRDTSAVSPTLMITPALEGDYWTYRVQLNERQSVVGFGKFGTVGIGFSEEEDWNSNLPYGVNTLAIVRHIFHNGGPGVTVEQTCEAVHLIRLAAYKDFGPPPERLRGQKGYDGRDVDHWEVDGVVLYNLEEVTEAVAAQEREDAEDAAELDS